MTKYVYIGKETVSSIDEVYNAFSRVFSFPEYFGRNLDALFDILTEGNEERIVLIGSDEELTEILGEKASSGFLRALDAAVKENDMLKIRRVY